MSNNSTTSSNELSNTSSTSFSSSESTSASTSTTPPPTTTPTTSQSTTSQTTSSTSQQSFESTIITSGPNGQVSTVTEYYTSTAPPVTGSGSSTTSPTSSPTGTLNQNGTNTDTSGLSSSGKTAIAVVVPIVAVAVIALAILFFWRKRKQRKDAEELRRKEVEEYGYNPNNDPTLPSVGGTGSDGPFEMREEGASGYRGWGTTAVASSGRKASTTVSGGQSGGGIGQAYSGDASPPHGANSDTRSGDALIGHDGNEERMGAMGPAVSGNRTHDINRGPSNASSQYSTAARSDGSGEGAVPGGAYGAAQYYSNDQYNPYNDPYGSPPGRAEISGQPVIRDVSARRNTRIENPSHFPQQSAGISQNF